MLERNTARTADLNALPRCSYATTDLPNPLAADRLRRRPGGARGAGVGAAGGAEGRARRAGYTARLQPGERRHLLLLLPGEGGAPHAAARADGRAAPAIAGAEQPAG